MITSPARHHSMLLGGGAAAAASLRCFLTPHSSALTTCSTHNGQKRPALSSCATPPTGSGDVAFRLCCLRWFGIAGRLTISRCSAVQPSGRSTWLSSTWLSSTCRSQPMRFQRELQCGREKADQREMIARCVGGGRTFPARRCAAPPASVRSSPALCSSAWQDFNALRKYRGQKVSRQPQAELHCSSRKSAVRRPCSLIAAERERRQRGRVRGNGRSTCVGRWFARRRPPRVRRPPTVGRPPRPPRCSSGSPPS